MRLGLPNSIQQLLFAAGFAMLFWIIGKVGTEELAVANVLVNIPLLAVLPGIGFGIGAASLAGQSLGRAGGGMFVPEDGTAQLAPDDTGTEVIQGALEASNVQAVSEVTRLIDIQQAYQHALNLISSEDDLKKEMLSRIGQTS